MSSIQVIFTVAVSGAAVIILALKLHKSLPPSSSEIQFQTNSSPPPRPCISTGEKKFKKKKKVRFTKDVVELSGNNEFRRRIKSSAAANSAFASTVAREKMPANRATLYNGILRDRVVHRRLGYSY